VHAWASAQESSEGPGWAFSTNDSAKVGALRKVLSQEAIGVLVRPALPRTLRIPKIDVNFGRQRKAAMIRKFLAPVPGQGLMRIMDYSRSRARLLSFGFGLLLQL